MNDVERARIATYAEELLWKGGIVGPPVPSNAVLLCAPKKVWRIIGRKLPGRGYLWLDGERCVIFVNSADSVPMQRFTLFHEAAHVLLKTQPWAKKWQHSQRQIERFCDAFAASILMPGRWVYARWPGTHNPALLATAFGVSSAAMVRRLAELGLLMS